MDKTPLYITILIMAIVISILATYLIMNGKHNSTNPYSEDFISVLEEKEFNSNDFQWPQLLELLDSGEVDNILNQESDWVFLILIYLGDINELFADPDMNMFIDPQCFNRIYKPEMKTKLESVMWTNTMPKVFSTITDILSNDELTPDTIRTKYPFVSKLLGEIVDQLPSSIFDRLFYLKNIRQIFKDRAHKDARTLMSEYKCDGDGVTERIYNNAYLLINKYSMRQSNN